ncbi:heparan-alpha-glucosaminide N-acetyltransferase domain-containing protein [Georgenia sp. Z1344]|uniref:heparan-alpha-glucosaminide N-acetyltransferase domain-containing protein n=1 Tax=Georgenia sp. Z1344 TaxID=3416706 RepID=UPI003CE753C8
MSHTPAAPMSAPASAGHANGSVSPYAGASPYGNAGPSTNASPYGNAGPSTNASPYVNGRPATSGASAATAARTTESGPAAPRSTGRLVGLDLARGIAVLGMVTAHVGYTTDDLSTLSGWLGFAHGRSSILFCLLAGVSLGILTGGRTPYTGVRALQSRTRILVRAVLLLAITALLAMLDTFVALILGFYAVWFMFSLPFHRWRARRLLVVGGVWTLVAAIAKPYLLTLITASGMVSDSWGVNGAVLDALLGLYPGLVWFGLVLVGMGVARLDLRSWKVLLILLGAGLLSAGVGYGGGAALRAANVGTMAFGEESADDPFPGEQQSGQFLWVGEQPDAVIDESSPGAGDATTGGGEPWHFPGLPGATFDTDVVWPGTLDLFQATAHSASPVEMVGSGGVALTILAACLLLPRVVHLALLPIRAIGTMSLTAYSAHVIAIDWWPDTFATFEETNRPLAYLAGGLAIGCLAWYLTLGRGPLERLMHAASVRAARTDAGERVSPVAPSPGTHPWPTTNGASASYAAPAPSRAPAAGRPDVEDTSRFAPPPVHPADTGPA